MSFFFLYVILEQKLVESLAVHGIHPEDLASPLISEAEAAIEKRKELEKKKREYINNDLKKYTEKLNKIKEGTETIPEETIVENEENIETSIEGSTIVNNDSLNQTNDDDDDDDSSSTSEHKLEVEKVDFATPQPNTEPVNKANSPTLSELSEYRRKNDELQKNYNISLKEVLEVSDIRYTILSHLFLISIGDGMYDARSRALLKRIANILQVDDYNFIKIEKEIIYQIKSTQEEADELRRDETSIDNRASEYKKKRWLYMGLASISGGIVIGLTAGLAAPLISTGLGATLSMIHLGVHGTTAFLGSTAGITLISSAGTLTGASLTGMKMAKRTRGVSEFEFIHIEHWRKEYEENKKKIEGGEEIEGEDKNQQNDKIEGSKVEEENHDEVEKMKEEKVEENVEENKEETVEENKEEIVEEKKEENVEEKKEETVEVETSEKVDSPEIKNEGKKKKE